MENQQPSILSPEQATNEYELVDEISCARAGSLAAHGLGDLQIADVLLLSPEQFIAAKNSTAYKKKYAEEADRQIQLQIDLADGWDGVEERALTQVFQTLEYNRDPKYALAAAQIANKAARRRNMQGAPVVDASENGSGNTTNIIVLSLNKSYTAKSAENKMIDVSPRSENQPQRRSDLPSPKLVNDLLAPVIQEKKKELTELEQAFEQAGVFKDFEDE